MLRTTQTGQDGRYQFDRLPPGQYTVRESQPSGYFQGGQCAGSGGGIDTVPDLISAIPLPAGVQLVDYNFHEMPPGSLSGYVFQDGPAFERTAERCPDNMADIRDGRRTAGRSADCRRRDGTARRRNGRPDPGGSGFAGDVCERAGQAVTDANGFYQFSDCRPAATPCTKCIRRSTSTASTRPARRRALPSMSIRRSAGPQIRQLAKDPGHDAIVRIPLLAGQSSLENNFSEVLVERIPPPLEVPPTNPLGAGIRMCWSVPPPLPWNLTPVDVPRSISTIPVYGAGGIMQMTWHLSVVDGGSPAATKPERGPVAGPLATVSHLSRTQWISVAMHQGYWTMPDGAAARDGRRAGPHVRHPRRAARQRRLQRRRHRRSGTLPRRPVVHRPQPQWPLGRRGPVGSTGQPRGSAGRRRLGRRRQGRHRDLRPRVAGRRAGDCGRAGLARSAQ